MLIYGRYFTASQRQWSLYTQLSLTSMSPWSLTKSHRKTHWVKKNSLKPNRKWTKNHISEWELSVYNSPKVSGSIALWSHCRDPATCHTRETMGTETETVQRTSSPDRLCEPSFQWQHQLELRSQILLPFVYSRFQKKQTQGLLVNTIAIPFKIRMSGYSYFFSYQQSICSLSFLKWIQRKLLFPIALFNTLQ